VVLKKTKNNHHETPTFLLYSRVCLRKSLTAHGTLYSSLSDSLLGTDEHLGRCLRNDSWGSSISSMGNRGSSMGNRGSSISSMGNWGSSISSMGNWGSSISSSGNGGSYMSSNWDMGNSVDRGGNSLGNSLDSMGAGLVDNWLVDSLVGANWSSDVLGSVGGDVLEDGLGNVVGLDNGCRLVGGNGGGDVGVGGLSNRVGQGGDLGDDLSKSMSLSCGVGKVSSESVVLDGSRVMGWGTHKVGGCVTNNSSSWGHSHGASTGISNERGEKQEGVHGGSC